MLRTTSRTCMSKVTLSFKIEINFSLSLLASKEILAKLIVLTLTEPIFKADPPIELMKPSSLSN